MKHALITGGAKRVGREIALHLAQQGYYISLHYNHSQNEAQQTKRDIEAHMVQCGIVQGDLNEPHCAVNILRQATKKLGNVTLLINSASVFMRDDLAIVTADSLQSHMNVNCFSSIMLTQALFAQVGIEQEGTKAQVICLLDGMNGWSISPNFLSYSLSKLALEQFIKLQAASLAPNVRINGIALGATLQGHMDGDDTFAKIASLSPLGRNSNPAEVCGAIDFLERTPSITGQIISLSSGFNLQSISGARF